MKSKTKAMIALGMILTVLGLDLLPDKLMFFTIPYVIFVMLFTLNTILYYNPKER